MMMSPSSSSSASCSTVEPVMPAGIITHAARGLVSFATNSGNVRAPVAPSASSAVIEASLTSYTTHSWPSPISRRTMLAPIRPRPIIPSCMLHLPQAGPRSAAGVVPRCIPHRAPRGAAIAAIAAIAAAAGRRRSPWEWHSAPLVSTRRHHMSEPRPENRRRVEPKRRTSTAADVNRGTLSVLPGAGCGYARARRMRTAAQLVRSARQERPHILGDGGDLVQESFVGTEPWVFDGADDEDNDKARRPSIGLAAQHPSHPLDHLATAPAGGEDDGQIRRGHVDTLVKDLGLGRALGQHAAPLLHGVQVGAGDPR